MAFKIRRTAKGVTICQTTTDKLGFYGTTPVVQRASASQAVATDAPSNLVLTNEIRAALVALGLIKGSA